MPFSLATQLPPQAISTAETPAQPSSPTGEDRYSPDYWRKHLEQAIPAADAWSKPGSYRDRQMNGPYYAENYAGGSETHCGWYWKFITDLKPALVAGDPAVSVSSTNPDATGEHADALEQWLNRAIKEQGLSDTLDRVAHNMLLCGGCLMITPEEVPETTSSWMAALGVAAPRMTAKCRSLDFVQIFADPDNDISESEYMGHWEVLTVRQILEWAAGKADNDGWDLEAVRAQAEGGESDAKTQRDKIRGDGIRSCTLKADQLVVYRIWCRDTQTIHTLAYRQVEGEAQGKRIRMDQPWEGHDRGPYVWFGVAWVRGRPYPMALTAVGERLIRELDAHRAKAREDAENAKNGIAFGSVNAQKAWAKLRNGQGFVADAKEMKEASAGGVQEETFEYIAYLEAELEKMFGLSEVRQGDTGADASATAVVAAETAQSVRRKYFERRFRACVREALKRMAHIGWHNQQVETEIVDEDQMTGERGSATYYGGVAQGDPAEWRDVESEIDLEPYTMGLVDQDSIRRSMTEVGLILQDIQTTVIQNPIGALVIRWENWLDDRMEAANIPGGGRRYINYAAMRAVVRMQLAGMLGLMGGGGPDAGSPGGMTVGAGGMGTPSMDTPNPMQQAQSVGNSAGQAARGMPTGA